MHQSRNKLSPNAGIDRRGTQRRHTQVLDEKGANSASGRMTCYARRCYFYWWFDTNVFSLYLFLRLWSFVNRERSPKKFGHRSPFEVLNALLDFINIIAELTRPVRM